MKELTKEEFETFHVVRMQSNGMFTEKRWYHHNNMLGIIIFDHDNEWAIVVLAQNEEKLYCAVDTNVGFKTQDIAIENLALLFKECESEPPPCGPPLTAIEAAKIVNAKTGLSVDEIIEGMESIKIPMPGNN